MIMKTKTIQFNNSTILYFLSKESSNLPEKYAVNIVPKDRIPKKNATFDVALFSFYCSGLAR